MCGPNYRLITKINLTPGSSTDSHLLAATVPGVMDSPGLVDSSWTSVAREQLLEDLALPGEDGGAVAGYGSGGVVPEQ